MSWRRKAEILFQLTIVAIVIYSTVTVVNFLEGPVEVKMKVKFRCIRRLVDPGQVC